MHSLPSLLDIILYFIIPAFITAIYINFTDLSGTGDIETAILFYAKIGCVYPICIGICLCIFGGILGFSFPVNYWACS